MLQTLRGLSFVFVFATFLSSSLSSTAAVGKSNCIRHIDKCLGLEVVKAVFGLEYVVGKVSSEEIANVLDFKGEISLLKADLSPFLWNKQHMFGNLGYSLLLHFSRDSISPLMQSLADAEIYVYPYNASMHKEVIIHYLSLFSKWDSDKLPLSFCYIKPVIRALSGHELLCSVCNVLKPEPELGWLLLSLEYTATDRIQASIDAALQNPPRDAMRIFLDSNTAGFNESIRSRNDKLIDSISTQAKISLLSLKAINNIKFGNQAHIESINPMFLDCVMNADRTKCIELISARTDIDWLKVLKKQPGAWCPVVEMVMDPKITPDFSVAMEFIKHSRSTVPIRQRFEDYLLDRVDDLSLSSDVIGLHLLLRAAIARGNIKLIEKITGKIFVEPCQIYKHLEPRIDSNMPLHPVYSKAFIEHFPIYDPLNAIPQLHKIVYTALNRGDQEILGLLNGHKNLDTLKRCLLKNGFFPSKFMPRLIEALGYSEEDFTTAIWKGEISADSLLNSIRAIPRNEFFRSFWTEDITESHGLFRYLYKKDPQSFQQFSSQSRTAFYKSLELPEFEDDGSPKTTSAVMIVSIGVLVLIVVATLAYFISRRRVKQQM